MTMQQICIKAALPPLDRHWMKRLATAAGIPLDTARAWIYREVPATRRAEVARLVLSELDRIDALTAAARSTWGEYLEEPRSLVRRKA